MSAAVTFAEAIQSWHDFYVAAGAAAATLVGLLFVGLSLHIRIVVSHPDVRALARVTLTLFFVVLLVALLLLQPAQDEFETGLALVITGAVSLLLTIRPAVGGLHARRTRAMSVRILLARFGISALGFLGVGLTGALLLVRGDFRSTLSVLLWVVVIMLVIAVRNTWDLLVTVADRTQGSSRP